MTKHCKIWLIKSYGCKINLEDSSMANRKLWKNLLLYKKSEQKTHSRTFYSDIFLEYLNLHTFWSVSPSHLSLFSLSIIKIPQF